MLAQAAHKRYRCLAPVLGCIVALRGHRTSVTHATQHLSTLLLKPKAGMRLSKCGKSIVWKSTDFGADSVGGCCSFERARPHATPVVYACDNSASIVPPPPSNPDSNQ